MILNKDPEQVLDITATEASICRQQARQEKLPVEGDAVSLYLAEEGSRYRGNLRHSRGELLLVKSSPPCVFQFSNPEKQGDRYHYR